MYYNDVPDHIQCYEVIMYADHRVVFYANKDPTVIENRLNNDMGNVKNFCFTNELAINNKKGKTEVMLFGKSKRLKSSGKKPKITFSGKHINFVTYYKYFSIINDNTVTLNDNRSRTYKAAGTRLQLPYPINLYQDAGGQFFFYRSACKSNATQWVTASKYPQLFEAWIC